MKITIEPTIRIGTVFTSSPRGMFLSVIMIIIPQIIVNIEDSMMIIIVSPVLIMNALLLMSSYAGLLAVIPVAMRIAPQSTAYT
jgi:hypothetical protein